MKYFIILNSCKKVTVQSNNSSSMSVIISTINDRIVPMDEREELQLSKDCESGLCTLLLSRQIWKQPRRKLEVSHLCFSKKEIG